MKIKSTQGFTIVEILIVIIVIGILAAVTLVGYSAVVARANESSVQSDLSKLADAIKLKNLDDQTIPAGGITSAGVGTASNFTGVTFKPVEKSYDKTVTNLYYCEGLLDGIREYAVVARAASGKAFSFISNKGASSFSPSVWTAASNGPAVCGALGFVSPFSWSYGYNGSTSAWSGWATP